MVSSDAILKTDLVYGTDYTPTIKAAHKSSLFDVNNREYLDFESCNGAALLGYSALDDSDFRASALISAPSFVETDRRLIRAQRLSELAPIGDGSVRWRVGFETTGAGGIELALRIAGHVTANPKIFTLAGGYHGRSIFLSAVSASQRYRTASYWTTDDRVTRLPVYEEGDPNGAVKREIALRYLADELWGGGAGRYGPAVNTPIFLFEPYQNVGGGVRPDSSLIRSIIDEVRHQNGLVVVDETFTGLYRMGTRWGFEYYDLIPDIFVGSKALGNGIAPVSCVWVREGVDVTGAVGPGLHSSTFASNALAGSVVDSVLDLHSKYGEDALVKMASDTGGRLQVLANHLRSSSRLVKHTSVDGAVLRVVLTIPVAAELRAWLTSRGDPGVLGASTGLAKDTLLLYPPITTDATDFERARVSIAHSLLEYERSHYLERNLA